MSVRSRSGQLLLTFTSTTSISPQPRYHGSLSSHRQYNQSRSFHHMALIGRGKGRGGGGRGGASSLPTERGRNGSDPSRFSNSASEHRHQSSSQSRGWQQHDSGTTNNTIRSGSQNIGDQPVVPRISNQDQFPHYRDQQSHHSDHRKHAHESSSTHSSQHYKRPNLPSSSHDAINGAAHSAMTSFKRSPLPQRNFHAAMQVLSIIGQRLLQCENDYQKTLRRNNMSSEDVAKRRAVVAAAAASELTTTSSRGLSGVRSTLNALSTKTDLETLSSALADMEEEAAAAAGGGEDWFHKLGRDIMIDDDANIAQFGDAESETSRASTKQEQYAAVEQTLSYINSFLASFADFRIQVLNDSSLTLAERSNFYATCIGMLTEAVDVSRARYLTNQISHGTRSHTQSGGLSRATHTDTSNNIGGAMNVTDESGARQKFPPPNTSSRRSTDPPLPFISSALGCISEAKAFHIPLTVYHYLPLLRSKLLVKSDTGLPMRLLDDAVRTIKETIYLYGRGDVRFKRATLRHQQETKRNETELAHLRKIVATPPLLSDMHHTSSTNGSNVSSLSRDDASLLELLQNIGSTGTEDGDDALFNVDVDQDHELSSNGDVKDGALREAAVDTSGIGKGFSLAQLLSSSNPSVSNSGSSKAPASNSSSTSPTSVPLKPTPSTPPPTSYEEEAVVEDEDGASGVTDVIKTKFVLDAELFNAWDTVNKKKGTATKANKKGGRIKKQDPVVDVLKKEEVSAVQEEDSSALDLEIHEISLLAAHNEAEMIVSGAQIAVASGYAVAGKWEHALYCAATPSAFRKLSRNLIDSGRWEVAAELVAHLINQVPSTTTSTTTPTSASDSATANPKLTPFSSPASVHPLLTSLPLVECVTLVGREAIEGLLHSNEGGGGGGGFFVPSSKDRSSTTTSTSTQPSPSAASLPASSIASVKAHRLENPCAMTRINSPDATHIYGVLYDVAQRFGHHQWKQWELWRREQAARGVAVSRRDSSVTAEQLSDIANSYYHDLGVSETAPPSVTTCPTSTTAPSLLPNVYFLSRTIVEGLVLAAPATHWDLGLRLLTAHTIHYEAKRQMMETNIICKARLLAKLRMSSSPNTKPPLNAASTSAFNRAVDTLKHLNRHKEQHEEVGKVHLGAVLRAFHRAHQWERVLQLYHDKPFMTSTVTQKFDHNGFSSDLLTSSPPSAKNAETILKSIFAVKPNIFDAKQTHWSVVDRGHVLLTLGQAVLYHGNALSAEGRSARTLPPGELDDEPHPPSQPVSQTTIINNHLEEMESQSAAAEGGWKDEDFEEGSSSIANTQNHKRYTAHDILAFLDGNFPGIHKSRESGSQYSVHTHMAVINMLGRGGSGCPPGLAWERSLMSLHHVDPRANKSIDVVIWQLAQSGLWEQATKTFASFMRSRRAALSPTGHGGTNNSSGSGGSVLTGSVSTVKYLWPQCSFMILASIYARQATVQYIDSVRKLQQQHQQRLLSGKEGEGAVAGAGEKIGMSSSPSTNSTPMEMLLRLAEMGVARTDHWNIMHAIVCLLCTAPTKEYLDTYALPELRRRGIMSVMATTNPQFISLGNYFFKQLHDCAKFHCEQEWAAPNGADGTEYIHSLADLQLQPMRLLRRPPSEFADGLPLPASTSSPQGKTALAAALQNKQTCGLAGGSAGGVTVPVWHLLNGQSLSVRVRRNALLEDRWAQSLRVVSMLAEKPAVDGQATQYFETLPLLPACAATGLPTSFFF